MDQLRDRMRRDQAEIEASGARTRTMLNDLMTQLGLA
jgi:hypothetical protein